MAGSLYSGPRLRAGDADDHDNDDCDCDDDHDDDMIIMRMIAMLDCDADADDDGRDDDANSNGVRPASAADSLTRLAARGQLTSSRICQRRTGPSSGAVAAPRGLAPAPPSS